MSDFEKERWLSETIAQLEREAESVREAKRETRPRRPLIIEFCGSPKSGKSSAITALTIFLKRNGFRVEVLTERASVCPIADKKDWLFNTWTAAAALVDLTPRIASPSSRVDVVICDRGVFDAVCWFRWLRDEHLLPPDSYGKLVDFVTLPRLRAAIDLVFTFVATPEKSVEREYANLLTRKRGSIMNESVLAGYRTAIENTVQELGHMFPRVESIDTSALTQDEVGKQVTERVLEALLDASQEHVGYLDAAAVRQARPRGKTVFPWGSLGGSIHGSTLSFAPRTRVESDDGKLQLIPAVVLTNLERTKVLVFRKSERSLTGTDSPERRKTLPYAGGHIRREDAFGLPVPEILAVAVGALEREVREELGVTLDLSTDELWCIWDDEGGNPRSRRHMALLFVVDTDLDELKVRLDDYEFVQPGGRTQSGTVLKAVELAADSKNLEAWGRGVLQAVFKVLPQGQPSLLEGFE
ncbi:MAG TPA: hypothetical protein VGK17_11065 [Propionicimonas sp.]